MDTNIDRKIPKCGSLDDLTGKRVIVGAKQLRKALQKGIARYVFLAENADPAITEPVEALCLAGDVAYSWVPTMDALGNACGIEVGAAAAAVID